VLIKMKSVSHVQISIKSTFLFKFSNIFLAQKQNYSHMHTSVHLLNKLECINLGKHSVFLRKLSDSSEKSRTTVNRIR
jgi:hypothetical protein